MNNTELTAVLIELTRVLNEINHILTKHITSVTLSNDAAREVDSAACAAAQRVLRPSPLVPQERGPFE